MISRLNYLAKEHFAPTILTAEAQSSALVLLGVPNAPNLEGTTAQLRIALLPNHSEGCCDSPDKLSEEYKEPH